MFADEHSSAIYYLLTAGDFSALHALTGAEVYHFYAGAPVRMLLLDGRSGHVTEPVLFPALTGRITALTRD